MNYIVRKSSKVARYTKNSVTRILRTPITKTFTATERAVYQVAGHYNKNDIPDSGFIEQATENNVRYVEAQCLQRLLNYNGTRPSLQIWREVKTDVQPMSVWYGGAYATSAPSPDAGGISCESYYQMGAYKFDIPEAPSGVDMSVSIIYETGGAVVGQGPAASRRTNQFPLREATNSDFSTYWSDKGFTYPVVFALYFGDLPSRYGSFHYDSIAACPCVEGFDMLTDGKTGSITGARDLWHFTNSNQDGGIPTLATTLTKTKKLTASESALFAGHKTVWVIPFFEADYSGSGTTAKMWPLFVMKNQTGWWACMSVWRPRLKITIGS